MIVGGLRARLLHDSLQLMVQDGLTALGWFDAGRSHLPIRFVRESLDWDEPVTFNLLIVSTSSRKTGFVEVGSDLSEDTVTVSIDIYAQNDSVATDLTNDVRDLLRGRLDNGAMNGSMPILDLRMATPVAVGNAILMDVRATRMPSKATAAYARHWFGVDVNVIDTYYDSSEAP